MPTFSWLDGCEIADLTVDCNMRGHQGAMVAIGAINVVGTRVRIRRVQAVDFGSEGVGTLAEFLECFVINTGGHATSPNTHNSIVEDCLVHRPSPNNFYTTSCIAIGAGGEDRQSFHRQCVMRNCFVNCEYEHNPTAISWIEHSGTIATVFTKTPHGRRTGDWVVVTGALMNGAEENPYNGSFQITVLTDQSFEYTLLWTPDDLADPTGDMWIGKRSSHIALLKEFAPEGDTDPYNPGDPGADVNQTGPNEWTVTIVTEKPHLRVPGENITAFILKGGEYLPDLARLYRVSEVVNPTKLECRVDFDPGAPDALQPTGFINPVIQGLGADAGVGALVHNNRVFHAWSSYYHDSYGTRDLTIRKNLLHDTVAGIHKPLGQFGATHPGTITASSQIATFTTNRPHYLKAGDAVFIGPLAFYNHFSDDYQSAFWTAIIGEEIAPGQSTVLLSGAFEILSVPSANQFTFKTVVTQDCGPLDAAAKTMSRVGRMIVERNIIDQSIYPWKRASGVALLYGIVLTGQRSSAPFVIRDVFIRRNVIQHVNQASDTFARKYNILFDSAEHAILERNIMAVTLPRHVVVVFPTGTLKTLGNETPPGKLIQPSVHPEPSTVYLNELATETDLFSCFER